LVEWFSQRRPHLPGQMRVEGRGARTAMAQVVLNHPQVEPGFQQVGGVGMSQRMHVRPFGDTAAFERRAESTLQTAARDRATIVRQAMGQSVARGCGKQPHG